MKKLLIVVVIVLIVVFGLAPRLVGGRAQDHYERLVEQLRTNGAQVTRMKYDRGWFSAQADTELLLPLPPGARELPQLPEELRISLSSTLHHGPLTSLGGLGLAQIDTRILLNGEQLFPDDYPARLRTRVALDGATRTVLDLPPVKLAQTGERPAIDFRGLSGFLTIAADFSRMDARLESPGALIAGGKIGRLDIGALTVDSKGARGVAGLMLGDAKLALSGLQLETADAGGALSLSNLYAEGSSNAAGELVAGSARYRIGALRIGDQAFQEIELKMSAGNLSAAVLAQIQQALDEIQTQALEPQMQGRALLTTLLTQLPLLLEHDPLLAVDLLRVDTPDGRVEGQLSVQSRGLRWEDLQGGGTGFLKKLLAEAHIELPQTLLRQLIALRTEHEFQRELALRRELGEEIEVPSAEELQRLIGEVADQQIAALMEQRLLVREGAQLRASARFELGTLTVNGETVPLPFLPPQE